MSRSTLQILGITGDSLLEPVTSPSDDGGDLQFSADSDVETMPPTQPEVQASQPEPEEPEPEPELSSVPTGPQETESSTQAASSGED